MFVYLVLFVTFVLLSGFTLGLWDGAVNQRITMMRSAVGLGTIRLRHPLCWMRLCCFFRPSEPARVAPLVESRPGGMVMVVLADVTVRQCPRCAAVHVRIGRVW